MPERKSNEVWARFVTILALLAGVTNALFGASWIHLKGTFAPETVIMVPADGWGWAVIILGALQAIGALLLIARKNYARIFMIVIAALGLIVWTGWAGPFSIAGVMALILDTLVIYGLSVTREDFN